MADRRRGESKQLKKDQTVRREVRDEIGMEIVQNHTGPLYRNANRDQARGEGRGPWFFVLTRCRRAGG